MNQTTEIWEKKRERQKGDRKYKENGKNGVKLPWKRREIEFE